MQRKYFILSTLILLLTLWACTSPTPPPPTNPSSSADTPAIAVDPGFNILVALEGEIKLERSAWSDYYPTTFGTVLERGDLLRLAQGAKATVLCDDLTIWQVPTGDIGLTYGCHPSGGQILVGGAIGIASTVRGPTDPFIPYIISPRMTNLLSNTPTLRWNDTGAASYKVQISGGDLNWSRTGVTQNDLVYPGEPALQPGVSYSLVITEEQNENPKSSQHEGQRAGLGFNLLANKEAKQVQTIADQLAGLSLSDEAKAFAQAQFFTGHGLIAEAIEILEGLVKEGNQQAMVHQTLADLYAQIGLVLKAEPRYLEAARLAEAQGNIEAMAAIQTGLGRVYTTLGNNTEASSWLTKAQASYNRLGDKARVDEIGERLAELPVP